MNQKETEETWDRMDERVHAKWGGLTRAERNSLTVKWRSLHARVHGPREGVAADDDRAIAALGQSEV